jgi:G3E family GTPase
MELINVSIITGFLGVGKTTLIKKLIKVKPPHENWAVIVNEFGEIGVDALLLEDPSIVIKQVPGGCACCAAQLPFQLALNQLLKSKTLHRIFIEPSGLGHADSLSVVLQQSQYEKWLNLSSVVTLIDPKQYSNKKYRDHEIYQRQLNAANGFLVSKGNLASQPATQCLTDYLASQGLPYLSIDTESIDLLYWMDTLAIQLPLGRREKRDSSISFVSFRKVREQGDPSIESDFSRLSIELNNSDLFNVEALKEFVNKHAFTRIKGLLNTPDNIISINSALSQLSIEDYKYEAKKLVIEIIHHEKINKIEIEQELRSCII